MTVQDTFPPAVNAGPDVNVEATASSGANYDVLTQSIIIDSLFFCYISSREKEYSYLMFVQVGSCKDSI